MSRTLPNVRRNWRKWTRHMPYMKGGRRQYWPWREQMFVGANVAFDSTVTTFDLADYADLEVAPAALQGTARIHHITFKGGLAISWQQAATTYVPNSLKMGLYVAEGDDADTDLWLGAANAWSHRMLWWDCRVMTLLESTSISSSRSPVTPGIPVRFDLKWRRPLILRPDEHLYLAFQFYNDATSVLSTCDLYGHLRESVQLANVGR